MTSEIYHRLDKRYGDAFVERPSRQSGQVEHLHIVPSSVRRQEMHHTALSLRLHEQGPELVHGACMLYSRLGAQLLYGQASLPDYIVYGEFVCIHGHLAVLHVYQCGKAGEIKTEEIQERRILAERIGVVGIVHAGLVIAQKEHKSGLTELSHLSYESCSPVDISLFCKHG